MTVLFIYQVFYANEKGQLCIKSVEEGSAATGLLEDSHKAVFQNPAQKLLYWQTARKQVGMGDNFQHAAHLSSAMAGSTVP